MIHIRFSSTPPIPRLRLLLSKLAATVEVFSAGQAFVGGTLNRLGQFDGFLYSTNIAACDRLTTTISLVQDHLTASLEGETYQWINCDTGDPIAGADLKEFVPAQSGNYKVQVFKGSVLQPVLVFRSTFLKLF